jgi:hypothetical protein
MSHNNNAPISQPMMTSCRKWTPRYRRERLINRIIRMAITHPQTDTGFNAPVEDRQKQQERILISKIRKSIHGYLQLAAQVL